MSDASGFVEAIRRDPSDAPRLIYADWLDDHGQPDRAEFIRLGCELARVPPYAPERAPAERRYMELHEGCAARWLAEFGLVGAGNSFDRGVVTHVSCEPALFARVAEALFRAEPVTCLTLNLPVDEAARWLGCPGLEQLRWLGLRLDRPDPAGFRLLTDSGRLANVRGLQLSLGSRWSDAAWDAHLAALAESRLLGRLEHLDLQGVRSNDWVDGLSTMAAGRPVPPRLVGLDLPACGLTPAKAIDLAALPWLGRVAYLGLAGSRVGPDGLEALLDSPHGRSLTSLDLAGTWDQGSGWSVRLTPNVGEAGIEWLAGSPHAARLRGLSLHGNGVRDRAVAALLASPYLGELEGLRLGETWALNRPDGPDDFSIGVENCERLRAKFGERVQFV